MSTSSPPHPEAVVIKWLFFNPANVYSIVHGTAIPGHLSKGCLGELEWVDLIERKFNLQVDRTTVRFWTPNDPLNEDDVGESWIKDHPNVEQIASRLQPSVFIEEVISRSQDPDTSKSARILVTAAGKLQERTSLATKQSGHVAESPLQAMHRQLEESRAPIPFPPDVAARPDVRAILQQNPKTAIYDGFYARRRCPDC